MVKTLAKAKNTIGATALLASSKGNPKAFVSILLASALLVIGIVTLAAPGDTAHLWVDTNGGSCQRSPSKGTYNDGTACSSFDAAYQAAQPGDIVLVRGGNYSTQTLNTKTGASAPNIKICAESGQAVNINQTSGITFNNADYVTVCGKGWNNQNPDYGTLKYLGSIDGQYPTGVAFEPGTQASGVDGIIVDSAYHGPDDRGVGKETFGAYIEGGTTDIFIKNSDLCCNGGKTIFFDGTNNLRPVVKGNYMHDQAIVTVTGDGAPAHMECMYVNGTTDLVIDGNIFWRCRGTGAINFTCIGSCLGTGEPIRPRLVNNVFDTQYDPRNNTNALNYSVQGCAQCVGAVYQNNFSRQEMVIFSGMTVIGNVMPINSCAGGATYRYNVSSNVACSGGSNVGNISRPDVLTNMSYYTASSPPATVSKPPEWQYSATHPGIGAGDASNFPDHDAIDNPRSDGDPDAGPYEFQESLANLWIDQNGGSCQRSASKIPYDGTGNANSCSAAQVACMAAASGDLVLIRSGTNYNMTIENCKKTSMTTFRVPDDQDISVSSLTINDSDWITFDGGAQMALRTQDSDVAAAVYSKCANHVTISHVEVNGNGMAGDAFQVGWPVNCTNSYIQLDHNLVYGLVYKGGNHTDCIQSASSLGSFIIDGNRLYECGDGAMQFTDGPDWGAYAAYTGLQNVQITNNWINNKLVYGFGYQVGQGNLTFQGNTYVGNGSTQFNATGTQNIHGNIFDYFQNFDCTTSANGGNGAGPTSFRYNITDVDCPAGTNSTKVTNLGAMFVHYAKDSPQAWDLHLANGTTAAADTVPAGFYGAKDIDGQTRAIGAAGDAGSDEYGSGGGSNPGPSDTTAPTNVQVTAPSASATLVGNATLTATATDDVGVAGIQFKVDGNNVGSEDTSSPFSITWDSTSIGNGSHTVTATARDAAGNTATSSGVAVTVNNPSAPAGTLLLGNQTVEGFSDTISTQQAQAWPFTAVASGTAGNIAINLAAAPSAMEVGLYANSSGNPGALLAKATLSSPTTGWNTAALPGSVGIVSGTQYWIAVLKTGSGTLTVRDRSSGPCASKINAAPNDLTTLRNPFGAVDAESFSFCPVSAYVTAASSSSVRPADVNEDGTINIFDLSILLSNYGRTSSNWTNARADVNNNGTVDIFDLSTLLSGYGT